MKDAIAALVVYAAGQGEALEHLISTETFETVDVECPVSDPQAAFRLASRVVAEGGSVTLILTDETGDQELTAGSESTDLWDIDGPLDVFYPHLADREAPDQWATEDLVKAPSAPGVKVTSKLHLEKARWIEPLGEPSRGAWMGLTLDAFLGWFERVKWTDRVKRLFGRPRTLILLNDWEGPPVSLGSQVMVGNLEDKLPQGLLIDPEWPEDAPIDMLRALSVDLTDARPPVLKDAFARLITITAAYLLGEERSEEWSRPSRQSTTKWQLDDMAIQPISCPPALVKLARWVRDDPNTTRLAVARTVAASQLPLMLLPSEQLRRQVAAGDSEKLLEDRLRVTHGSERVVEAKQTAARDSERVIQAATIAYQTAIDRSVQEALRSQLELERSFLELDSKLGELRDNLRSSLDATIIRTLTASLGIVIAALTVSNARGWPTVVASSAVAAYVIFTAWWTVRGMGNDFGERLNAFQRLVTSRGMGLGNEPGSLIDEWKGNLKRRVVWTQVVLSILAVFVLAGGIALAVTLGPDATTGRTPGTSTPTPSSLLSG